MSNTKLIDCSNIKSLNYKRNSKRNKVNAQWENIVDIQLNTGDQINVENAIVNIKGVSSDATVEILAQDDKVSFLADNKVGIRSIPYICDNGENSVALPFCGFRFEPLFYEENTVTLNKGSTAYDTGGDVKPFPNSYPNLKFYDGQSIIFNQCQYTTSNVQVYPNVNQGAYNFGQMSTDQRNMCFSFWRTNDAEVNQIRTPLKYELYTNFSEFPTIGNFQYNSGLKYTIINSEYKGPFRSNWTGSFHSNENDFKPEYLDIKLDLKEALYESPSTICNVLNDQLNNSNEYYNNPSQLENAITDYFTMNKLPQITGTLCKTKMVNGRRKTSTGSTVGSTTDSDPRKLWGNIGVRDYNDWHMVHSLMRCSLTTAVSATGSSLEGLIFLGDGFSNDYKTFRMSRPVYHIPGGRMRVSDKLNDNSQVSYDIRSFYPRIGVNITIPNPDRDKYISFSNVPVPSHIDLYQKIYYSTLPQYFVICFNIEYTRENIKRISDSFRKNEIYDGSFTSKDQYDNDINNWRIHMDNGESQMGDQSNWEGDKAGQKNYGFCQGAMDFRTSAGTGEADNDYNGYGYSMPSQMYKITDFCPDLEQANSTPKSDVPDIGCSRFELGTSENKLNIQTGTTRITGSTESPVFFKNNKHRDCRPAFFSRYDANWKTLFKTSNVPNGMEYNGGTEFIEGLGEYVDGECTASTGDDDDLSKEFNIGVYPFLVKMNPNVSHNMCGMLLYRDSATFDDETKKFVISNDFALPCLHHGQFAVSTSFYDHPAVWLVNGRKYNETTKISDSILKIPKTDGMVEKENISEIIIGCTNPTLEFDNNLSKVTFSNLHNVKKLGLFDMASASANSNTAITYTLSNMGDETVKINNTNVKYPLVWDLFTNTETYEENFPQQITRPPSGRSWNLIHSTSGIFLENFYGQSILSDSDSFDDMTLYTADNWSGSLLNKLGFEFTDLIPIWGNQSSMYDYSKIHTDDPQILQKNLKPLSTNPLIDISSSSDLAVSDYTAGQSYDKQVAGSTQFGGLPVYDMSIGTTSQINLDGSNSELIIASNLPTKLTSPYFLVYSNIGNGDYVQNRDSLQVVGIILKNYISGDFIYSFASQGFTVLSPMKLTSIKIVIRDNSGRIVSLNENNSIIFKITRQAFESVLDAPEPINNPSSPSRKKK